VGLGKIFDPRCVDGRQWGDQPSWSRPYVHVPKNPDSEMGFLNPDFVKRVRKLRKEKNLKSDWGATRKAIGGVPPVEHSEDVPDDAYEDGALAEAAVGLVKEMAAGRRPFFLAVGFHKPHLPFIAPQKYWRLYSKDQIALAEFQQMPLGAPGFAFQDSWELKNGSYAVPRGPGLLPRDLQRELVHGYYACVSYVDAQIGKVLDALEAAGVADDTIVVLWGDHGWHLGDHGMWCKHTNYEQATRAPLIIARRASGPGLGVSKWPVEFVDIFPTLCDLAGLPKPKDLAGVSLVPVLDDPAVRVKEVAVSQYPRHRKGGEVMGYAFRDTRYRYVQWVPRNRPHTGPAVAEELYDYQTDPLETKSLANDPAYAGVLALMRNRAQRFHARSR
jgi:arylsulfatase A-like enzyme